MGRLQRKKSTTKKKKKKPNLELASSPKGANAVVSRKTAIFDKSSINGARKTISLQKPTGTVKKGTPENKIGKIFDKGIQFLREVKVELKKVTWPSRKQTLGSTAVVIVLVIIIAIYLGVVDFGLSGLMRVVLK
ncbi:MAG: preprotein translocase subunit SecE [Desulfobacterales bacterium]